MILFLFVLLSGKRMNTISIHPPIFQNVTLCHSSLINPLEGMNLFWQAIGLSLYKMEEIDLKPKVYLCYV